jgi:quercetin dioxygenase-like cupin family protein
MATIGLVAISGFAQDPFKVAPQAYKLDFENEWVKVARVHYGPHEKIPAHDHTKTAAAYVYLNDGGPVIFRHIGLAYGAITRQPTKAGSFRLYQAVQEVHEVENTSDLPSDFLRVEFKTKPINESSLRGRFYREDYPAAENYKKVQFENEQIRVTRLVCATGKTLDLSTNPTEPALLIALSQARLTAIQSGAANSRLSLAPGKTLWVAANQQRRLENSGDIPVELLRFDFKTGPGGIDSTEKGKPHNRPPN